MNDRQRNILIYAGAAIVAMLLFPPYVVQGGFGMGGAVVKSGYAFLLDLPPRATVEVGTLLLQWLAVVLVGGIALALAKGAPARQDVALLNALHRLEGEAIRQQTAEPKPKQPLSKDAGNGIVALVAIIGWVLYYWLKN